MATAYFLNQYVSTTLAVPGGITDVQTTGIILSSLTNIDYTKPGIACLSYTDPLDTSKAEWITYTSINDSTKELQGVGRGTEGFAAKAHNNGVTVAFPLSESHINNLNTALSIGGVATNLVTGTIDDDTMATASATTLATSESIKNFVGTGWIPCSETWTRTGNHTFTVAGDLTAKYRKGAKVRYKDGGAYDYGTVISSSYSSPNTTVTLATNTDYVMAAATITDTYISYIENPEGFPMWFNYVPTWGNLTIGNAVVTAKFNIINNIVYGRLGVVLGNSSSVSGDFTFTLPSPSAAYPTLSYSILGEGAFLDSGTLGVKVQCQYASSTTAKFRIHSVSGTLISGAIPSSTVPFTWAVNDEINIANFSYQMA